MSAIFVTGCGTNAPQTLSALQTKDAQQDAAMIIGNPMYDRVDKFSFSLASAKYPANGGKHTIPVGNYLLLRTMEVMQHIDASQVKLDSFSSDCNRNRLFTPEAVCTADYKISYFAGRQRAATGHIERNIGNVRVKDDNLLLGVAAYRDYGDGTILGQVRLLMDAVVDDLKRHVLVPLSLTCSADTVRNL